MSASNLPKSIMYSPNQDDKSEELSVAATRNSRMYEVIKTHANNNAQDMHQNRIKTLRKELDYLKETKWKYEAIDTYIGSSQ